MKRRLFTILSALSLLICIAGVALWIRSYRAFDSAFRLRTVPDPTDATLVRESIDGFSSGKGCVALTFCRIVKQRPTAYKESPPHYTWFFDDAAGDLFSEFHQWEVQTWRWKSFAVLRYHPTRLKTFDGTDAVAHHGSLAVFKLTNLRIIAPLWAIVLPSGLLAAAHIRLTCHRVRRRYRGQCPSCGYDVRAIPNRCPECGTPISPEP